MTVLYPFRRSRVLLNPREDLRIFCCMRALLHLPLPGRYEVPLVGIFHMHKFDLHYTLFGVDRPSQLRQCIAEAVMYRNGGAVLDYVKARVTTLEVCLMILVSMNWKVPVNGRVQEIQAGHIPANVLSHGSFQPIPVIRVNTTLTCLFAVHGEIFGTDA